jgi:kinetochore protein NDC80
LDTEAELEKVSAEKSDLQRTVDMQEISPADVDRMTAEREQLARTLEAIAAKTDEVNKQVWEKEIALQKKMDQVCIQMRRKTIESLAKHFFFVTLSIQLEKHIKDHNGSAYRLGLLSNNSPDAEGVNFELELNVHATSASDMISEDWQVKAKVGISGWIICWRQANML